MKAMMTTMLMFAAILSSCDHVLDSAQEPGTLTFSFIHPSTRSLAEDIPDTNDFSLSVVDNSGIAYFKGKYRDAPRTLNLSPGRYTVTATSRDFSEPLFDAPQYGDVKTVEIESGVVAAVHLLCTQMNAGVRLKISESFAAGYAGGTLYIRSSAGPLVYTFGEKRTGYFRPGLVWLELNYRGETKTLFTRELAPRQILNIRLLSGYSILEESPVAAEYGEGISMSLDTSRNWTSDVFATGSGDGSVSGGGGGTPEMLSVGQAMARAGQELKDVWVYGYIVGGDLTKTGCKFSGRFESNQNLVLAAKKSGVDRSACLGVQLQRGDAREALNLVDNPLNLGRQVYLKGDLAPKYYGIPGLVNVTDFHLE